VKSLSIVAATVYAIGLIASSAVSAAEDKTSESAKDTSKLHVHSRDAK